MIGRAVGMGLLLPYRWLTGIVGSLVDLIEPGIRNDQQVFIKFVDSNKSLFVHVINFSSIQVIVDLVEYLLYPIYCRIDPFWIRFIEKPVF